MRAIRLSFFHMLEMVKHDKMLFAALLSPVLAGTAIHFGVPFAEKMLIQMTGSTKVLSPYYSLFDIFFASLTLVMFCFISSMVVLEERDDHIDRYLFITGLGRRGYFISRMILPAILALVITVILLPMFALIKWSAAEVLLLSLTSGLQGIVLSLLIVTLSSNKLEGMAVTKLSSLIMFGAVVPFFVPAPIDLCAFFLPSYWMGKAVVEGKPIVMLLSVLVAVIWILILKRKNDRKM
ncbi:MAG: ABC transporter permease [Blautia sp.]|nr:ABC transporter permease [Blautia sp.]